MREVRVTGAAIAISDGAIIDGINAFGRGIAGSIFLDVCVKLGKAAINPNPDFKGISRMHIVHSFTATNVASTLMNAVSQPHFSWIWTSR